MTDRVCAWIQVILSTVFSLYVAVLLNSRVLALLVSLSVALWLWRALFAGDEWERTKAELKAEIKND